MGIQVGQKAPDFTLVSHLDREYTLSEFQGHKNVVLVFFPWAWTPV
jgi:peroxiredoxin